MTSLSTGLQSVAGGLEIQLGNLWRVSPRGCHHRALWPHSAAALGLPCEVHFSQSTMVTRLPWCVALSLQERGPCHTMRDVGQPGMSAHREQQGHKAYQLQLPRGSISELKWRALGQRFPLFGKISIFSMGKENKNTILLIIIKKKGMIFTPDLSNQSLRNPKDWVSIKRILSGTLKNLRVGTTHCLGPTRPFDQDHRRGQGSPSCVVQAWTGLAVAEQCSIT